MKKVLIAIAILIALLLLVGLLLPGTYTVERSITIDAPVETVYDQVNDLEKNRNWSPWEEDDPTAKFSYSPVVVGVGAWYDWEGDKVGRGRLTIVDVEPNRRIDTALAFGDDTTAQSRFTFEETRDGVVATWSVSGELGGNFLARYLAPAVKGAIGKSFERGLANLKRICEAEASAPAPEPPTEPVPQA
jgi:uncharacterized protein YndB with AHSA1/START domain